VVNGAAIEVLYFAQVAEITRVRRETWPLPEPVPAAELLSRLESRHPGLAPVERLKIAINQSHANPDSLVKAGDEFAVFEPVTGG